MVWSSVPGANITPLIGRQQETTRLLEQLALAQAGQCRLVLLSGDPGIGKTRLLHAAAEEAVRQGSLVLWGGASEAEAMPSFLLFLEPLGAYIRSVSAETLRAQTGASAGILATLFPEVTIKLGHVPITIPLPTEQARLRLYEAVGTLLNTVAAAQPLVLILDDLQWADSGSLDLLCYVARRQAQGSTHTDGTSRLLILGAYREGDAATNATFQRALAELNRLRRLTIFAVHPLGQEELDALAARVLDATLNVPTAQVLYRQSEGNPFIAEELLRGWLETGALVQQEQQWGLAELLEAPLPAGIVSAVRQRLERLPAAVIDLLRSAAIIGRTFDVGFLAEVTGQDPDAVEERLREAAAARLLRDGHREGWYTFSHDVIRECLYGEVPSSRRRRLHGYIGRALEQRPEIPGPWTLAELAFHFARSGDIERGIAYSRSSADHALRSHVPDDAMTHYRTALDLLHPEDIRRPELLMGLGEAALLAGAEGEAVSAFQRALQGFDEVGDETAAARAAHRLGQGLWRQELIPAAEAAFERALALLEDVGSAEHVQVLVDLGTLLVVNLHRRDDGLGYLRQALAFTQQREDMRLEAAVSRAMGNLLVRANDIGGGVALLERALDLVTDVEDAAEASECCACLAIAFYWNAELSRLAAMVPRWLAYAERTHDLFQLRHIYIEIAAWHTSCGRWADADHHLALAQSVVERLASLEPQGFLRMAHGWLAYYRGMYAEAEAHFRSAVEIFRPMGPGTLVWYLGAVGVAQAALGKRQEVLDCMEELEGLIARHPGGTMPTSEPLTHLAVMATSLHDQEHAARIYPKLLAFAGQFHDFLVDRLLGALARVLGDGAAAASHLQSAEMRARKEQLLPELARTLESRADAAQAEGGEGSTGRTRELLEEAASLWERLTCPSEADRLRERVRRLSRRGADSRPRLPAGLTTREVEVLCLVTAGMSNREIAAKLVISEKTVINHLTNIYTKIDVDNRAAAVAFAIRHGLA